MTADLDIEWCRRQQAQAKHYIDTHAGSYVDGARACIRDCIMEEIIIMGERDEPIKEFGCISE